jgi:hypothetical protein
MEGRWTIEEGRIAVLRLCSDSSSQKIVLQGNETITNIVIILMA